MAENVTPVVLEIKDFEPREVMMVDYKFDQATDREGQIAGIPRGGKVNIRVKAMNDGNNQLIQWMLDPTSPKDFSTATASTTSRSGRTASSTSRRLRSCARNSRTVLSVTKILGSDQARSVFKILAESSRLSAFLRMPTTC